MTPKELRKKILEFLYEYRQEHMVEIHKLQQFLGSDIDDRTLHGEIIYLEEKYYLKILGNQSGDYLHYSALIITAEGIDLVEDPEEFRKLFSVNVHQFGDVSGSNINISSPNAQQSIQNSEITPEVQKLLEELKEAIQKKDEKKVFSILEELKTGAKSVFWGIVTNLITQ